MSSSPASRSLGHLPAPWWAVLTLPFGLTVGFATVAVPYVLRVQGIEMTLIATVSQAAQLPHVIKPFWAPVLDLGPRRRSWFFGCIATTALALGAAALIPPSTTQRLGPVSLLWIYAATLFLAQAAVATSSSAVLAMMALTVPPDRRGAASGWQTAGNLAGTAAGGALITWMLRHLAPATTAAALVVMCASCAIPAAWIHEEPLERSGAARRLKELFGDVIRTLRSRQGWTGLILCLSPVGAGGLTNLFSALVRDYAPEDASAEQLVVIVTGVLGGLVNAAGALLGGYVADRMDRRMAYVLCGGLSGLCAIAMMISPATPLAFTWGSLSYQLTSGLCYAAFYAFVLDLVGGQGGVTTQLALYAGAGNFASAYVTWLDGWAYDRPGALSSARVVASPRSAMLAMDAATTFVGIGFVLAVLLGNRRSRPSSRPA